jgi:hypothetical protein
LRGFHGVHVRTTGGIYVPVSTCIFVKILI